MLSERAIFDRYLNSKTIIIFIKSNVNIFLIFWKDQ